MDLRISELNDRELLEVVFFQNLLINKKLNAFFESNEELRQDYLEMATSDFEDTTESEIFKTILLYKEHKCELSREDIDNYKMVFNEDPLI